MKKAGSAKKKRGAKQKRKRTQRVFSRSSAAKLRTDKPRIASGAGRNKKPAIKTQQKKDRPRATSTLTKPRKTKRGQIASMPAQVSAEPAQRRVVALPVESAKPLASLPARAEDVVCYANLPNANLPTHVSQVVTQHVVVVQERKSKWWKIGSILAGISALAIALLVAPQVVGVKLVSVSIKIAIVTAVA